MMNKQQLVEIISDYKNRPNKDLINALEVMQQDFDLTKNAILDLTHHLDKIEKTYNLVLQEYQNRTKTKA